MPAIRRGHIWILGMLLLSGCIDPYTPDIDDSKVSLVVEALITDQPGMHTVTLSRSFPLNETVWIPVTGARVTVMDNQGKAMEFLEEEPGKYRYWMMSNDLISGNAYTLHIVTSDGENYESDPEQVLASSPPVESVYWEFETMGTSDPDMPTRGIQFYLDLDGEEDQARNFRWELEETWEYNAANRIQYYYDGTLYEWSDPFIYYTCWYTGNIPAIYIASTSALERNAIAKHPLNFVSEETSRLQTRYSLMVKQYALSDKAYDYWLQIQRQNQESGGIYETQPDQIPGNIHNLQDPEEEVLGYFNVSPVSEKRIFVDGIRELVYPPIDCNLDTIPRPEDKPPYLAIPFYLISLNVMGVGPPYGVGSALCFDCRKGGGVPFPPDFWE
jgi:hypothetical protein